MAPSTPPVIPTRTRYEGRRISLPPPTTPNRPLDANRVHVQPASPEVISNLITSLSIISSPANHLFEHSGVQSLPNSPAPTRTSFNTNDHHMHNVSNIARGGSFGIDYGAFNQPTHDYTTEDGPLDELAATSPVIRTSKPPSGFSPLTAPKSPNNKDANPLKTLLRTSRPTSRDSNADDAMSIGSVSIEPGAAPQELRRKSSSDSWGKKHGRNSKGLMYMSSKERLRDSERKRSSAGSTPKGPGLDRLPIPEFDAKSFMAESAITEEASTDQGESGTDAPAPSPGIGPPSPSLPGPNGVGPGRFIPTRDSSLRSKKRSSQSRRTSRHRDSHDGDGTIAEVDEHPSPRTDKGAEIKKRTSETSRLKEPLTDPHAPKSNGMLDVAERSFLIDEDEGAPSPAVAQRKPREKSPAGPSKNKRSGRQTPDPFERLTKSGSKSKRLSAPASPNSEKDQQQRSSSQPLSKKDMPGIEHKANSHNTADDRPSSADSIDDAVDAYLCSPRLSQKIRHPQTGRTISFSEVGDSEGFAVFCCVGMGLTRYITAFYDELALTLKLRLITPDRPGVGDSEPYTDGTATPLSWPDDVYAICQTLKITKFSILAHSAGAIYALATALRMPQHIRGRIHLLAPWIPPSQLNVFGGQANLPPSNSIPTSQRILRALPTPILKAANSSFMSATSSSITSSLPKQRSRSKRKSTPARADTPALSGRITPGPMPNIGDKENQGPHGSDYPKPKGKASRSSLPRAPRGISHPDDPTSELAILAAAATTAEYQERQAVYDTRLTHAIWDLATSNANPAVDLLVCLERRHTIGFRYVDITRAVVIHHGSKDTRVPVENVKWLGKMMRRCEVRILEGEGHGLMASAAVMGGVLMEIAREWEDWMRVVDGKGRPNGGLRERASVGAFR